VLYINSNAVITACVYSWYIIINQSRKLRAFSIFADVYYAAVYLPAPATIHVITALLGYLCIIDSDCRVKHSHCVGGACVCKDGHAETPDRQQCLGENVRSVQCMAVYRTTMSLNITCLHIIDWLQSVMY
jgi:hypothetical protein